MDSKLSIENDSNCATFHEILKKILCFNFYDRSSTFFVICVLSVFFHYNVYCFQEGDKSVLVLLCICLLNFLINFDAANMLLNNASN